MGSFRLLRSPDYFQLRYKGITRGFRGTEKQARSALARFVTEVDAGAVVRPSNASATVADLLGRHMAHLAVVGRSPATLRGYESCVKALEAHLGTRLVAELAPADIDEMTGRMIASGSSPATVRHRLAVLSGALKQAVRWGWIATTPMAATTPPRLQQNRIRPPAAESVRALVLAAATRAPALGTFVAILAATGCRRGEACALRWADLDGDAIVIARAIVEDGSKRIIEKDTKSHQIRRVALDGATLALLERWRSDAELWASEAGTALDAGAYIVSDDAAGRTPWRPSRVSEAWRRLCEAEGVKCRLHDVRHWHVSELLTAGLPAHEVAARVGHHPTMTLRTYGHVIRSGSVAAGVIGERLAGG